MKTISLSKGFLPFILMAFLWCSAFMNAQEKPLYHHIADGIKSDYYDAKRLDAQRFIKAFADVLSLELTLVTINVEPKKVVLNYKNHAVQEIALKGETVADILNVCAAIEKGLKKICSPEEKALLLFAKYKALYRGLKTMDPHSAIYDPVLSKEFILRSSKMKIGIGLDFMEEEGDIIVQHVYEKSTAEMAGIKEGDIIRAINGQILLGLPLKDVHRLIKNSGDFVKVDLQKKNSDTVEYYQLQKAIVKSNAVEAFLLNDEIGYFKIKRFSAGCFKQFREKLAKLESGQGKSVYWEENQWKVETLSRKAGIQSFILDLRGNPGGSFQEAIAFCDYFLPKGQVIVTEKSGKRRESYFSKIAGDVKTPLIILINEGSASSSEIVAGCLQNYHRALVLGKRSYGKGSVQQVNSMNILGAKDLPLLRLTRAEYFVAKNISIQNKGVTPNIKLIMAEIKKGHIRLSNPKARREVDRASSIVSAGTIKHLETIQYDKFTYHKDDALINKNYPYFNFDVRLAMRLLEGDGPFEGETWKNNGFYSRKKDICKSIKEEQHEKIKQAFAALGLQWESGGRFSKNLNPTLKVLNFEKSMRISLKDQPMFKVTLKNKSPYAANMVWAQLVFKDKRIRDQSWHWGVIPANSSKEMSVPLILNDYFAGCRVPYELVIHDEHHQHETLKGLLVVDQYPVLKFSFKYQLNHLDEKGAAFQVLIRLKKESTGTSAIESEFTLKPLLKGDVNQLSFSPSIYKNKTFTKGEEQELQYQISRHLITSNSTTSQNTQVSTKMPLVFKIRDRQKGYEVRQQINLDLLKKSVNKIDHWSEVIHPIEIKIDGEQPAGGLILPETNNITGKIISSSKITEVYLTHHKKKYAHQYYPEDLAKKELPLKLNLPKSAPAGRYILNIKTNTGTTYLRPLFLSRL